jgi:hypothetical protein
MIEQDNLPEISTNISRESRVIFLHEIESVLTANAFKKTQVF